MSQFTFFFKFQKELYILIRAIIYFISSFRSPSYQLSSKVKKEKANDLKEAPLADPEPTSDISHQNTSFTTPPPNNGTKPESISESTRPQLKALQSVQLGISSG